MRTNVKLYAKSFFSNIRYLEKHVRGAQKLLKGPDTRELLFREFLNYGNETGRKSLQIGARRSKLGANWVSVDLFDTSPLIDFNYDVRSLGFDDNQFDAIACNAILEHIDDPPKAIGELFRVLRPGGRIWVEVPLNQPYHPSPQDFWRVTPEGLRQWMKAFRERSCAGFLINNSVIYTGSYYYGHKPS
ncbi:MAG: class I SAM-dependent methyltransferase [Chitinispirillaceae bacterium]|nr:class I SAM-dependent methyltransferase [Chitinispirillaceae bacterium]